jgi:glycosyltransferase involved in cell wall biosynthesis
VEENPAFTVVIPMYNAEMHISRAVGSVLQQTVPVSQIIVVDDGSTDDGANLVTSLFSTVKVISQRNSGEGGARNTGISEASTEWIAFLDSDDFWLPNHLEVATRLIDTYPSVAVVSTAFKRWDLVSSFSLSQEKLKVGMVNYFKEQVIEMGVISSSTAVVKKEAFGVVGGFSDLQIGADLDMWERLTLIFPFARTNEVTAVYFQNPRGAIAEFSKEMTIDPNTTMKLLYRSKNVETSSSKIDRVAIEKYQNFLKFLNTKRLLYYGLLELGKREASTVIGSAKLNHRIFFWSVTFCPQRVLSLLIKIKNLI